MRIFYLLFFLFLTQCNTIKKVYVCGDRPCLDKKEFNEYFAKNLTIEVTTLENVKRKENNLIQLNTSSSYLSSESKNSSKQINLLNKRKEKDLLKAEKVKLKEERKIKKAQEKAKVKEQKEIAKRIKIDETENEGIIDKIFNKKNEQTKKIDKISSENTVKKTVIDKEFQSESIEKKYTKSICDEIQDCDIDKIAEILKQKGKDKPFPSITSK